MGSSWGNTLKISLFGESHGNALGVVLDGFPHGIEIDEEAILHQLSRRAPGKNEYSTKRKESDIPEIVSGIYQGKSSGAPICAFFKNSDTRSADYSDIADLPRPSHADLVAYIRYAGHNDIRGGGHFSGRLTAPLVFAGALCQQALRQMGIQIAGRICQIGAAKDATPFESLSQDDFCALSQRALPIYSHDAEQGMLQSMAEAQQSGDSVGGIVEMACFGIPAGWGNPMLDTLEGRIASLIFGVPAVKGIEFGSGFALAGMRGSESNDSILQITPPLTQTNHTGGINGGISNGMPIIFRVVIRPTPSISKEQTTVRLSTGKQEKLVIAGRHDPCIVPRVLPVLEAATGLVLLDQALDMEGKKWSK